MGSSTWVMILCSRNSSSFSCTSGCIAISHFLGACTTGFALLHKVMWYVPGKWPIPSNLSGYALMRSSFVLRGGELGCWKSCLTILPSVVGFFCCTNFLFWRLTAQLSSTMPSLAHDGSPRIAGPSVSAMYHLVHRWFATSFPLGVQSIAVSSVPNWGILDML